MIPTPEQLEEISRLHEGALGTPGPRGGPRDTVPFAALLLAFSAHRRTVIVEVRRKQISKRIVFEHGVPVEEKVVVPSDHTKQFALMACASLPAAKLPAPEATLPMPPGTAAPVPPALLK